MKVKLGPYPDWIGPYQIADKVFFWCDMYPDKDVADRWDYRAKDWLGEFLAHGLAKKKQYQPAESRPFGDERPDTWFYNLLKWIHAKRQRKVVIKTDRYDHWNAYHTMSLIIVPILKDLREHKHGAGFIADEDVPEGLGLRSTECLVKEDEGHTDENWFKRYEWALNEMIWAHEQIADDNWEDQYYSGEVDWVVESGGRLREGPNHTYKLDVEGFNKHNDRIENGLRLFGKYYRTLWD